MQIVGGNDDLPRADRVCKRRVQTKRTFVTTHHFSDRPTDVRDASSLAIQSRTFDPFTALRLQRGAEHLHRLGARATAELLAEVAARIGGMPCVLELLAEYECRLSPAMIRAAGADRFPRQLQAVPR